MENEEIETVLSSIFMSADNSVEVAEVYHEILTAAKKQLKRELDRFRICKVTEKQKEWRT